MTRPWIFFTLTLLAIGPLLLPAAAAFADDAAARSRPRLGIQGLPAPDLNLSTWIDASGDPLKKLSLGDLRGKVVYLYFFQDWCPGCHAHGFPTLRVIYDTFKEDDRVALLAVQTAFEGKHTNTVDKLRKNQIDYALPIPMAHDGGDHAPGGVPQTMKDYRSGGTPWTVIIDPDGTVVYNQFHIDPDRAVALINSLRRKDG